MIIGYARTSTVEQVAGLEAQERDLKAAGVEKVFAEQISAVDAKRPALAAALDFAREGDVFVVTKIDRLARSVADLLTVVDKLAARGVALKILSMGVDTSTPTGKLMVSVLGAVAEFERAIMLERQREGIAKARKAGKFKGRTPTARAKAGGRRHSSRGRGSEEGGYCPRTGNRDRQRVPHSCPHTDVAIAVNCNEANGPILTGLHP
jgi:DNA invertase Pin-like site-specific DNA recombinase